MNERRKDYREWVAKAESDCLCIHNNVASREVPWDVVCFHAQQAAEKYLKALLVLHQKDPPRIYDLVTLLDDCANFESGLEGLEGDCLRLTFFAVDARYPARLYDPDEQDGRRAVEAMERVRSAMLERLPGVHPETE